MKMRLLTIGLLFCLAILFVTVTATNEWSEVMAGEGYEWAAMIESDVQSNVETQSFDEYVSEHGRVYESEEARAQAFTAFEANDNANLMEMMRSRQTPAAVAASAVASVKAVTPTSSNASPPTSVRSRAVKPRRILNARVPGSKDKGKRVRVAAKKRYTRRSSAEAKALAKQLKANKNGNTQTAASDSTSAVGAGHAGGMAGGAGSQSGKTGGQSGKTGGQSGKTGGQSGKTGGQSGKTGGKSGKTGAQSGKTGGDAGGNGKKSGKSGGTSGGNGTKSGKTGGDAGTNGSKSGKTGGNKTSRKSVNTDSSLQPVLPPSAPSQPANTLTAEQRQNRATQYSMDLTQSARDNLNGNVASGAVGAVSPDSIRQGMLTEGMSVDEVNAAFNRARFMKIVASTPVQNHKDFGLATQTGSCGSCWAYSAIDAIQRIQALDSSNQLFRAALSTQQVLDCVRTADSNGCSGGSPMDAFDYFATNPIALDSEYPSTGKSGACRTKEFANRNRPYATGGWEMVIPACHDATGPCSGQIPFEAQLLEYWSSFTNRPPPPVVVYVDATNWSNYSGGVYDVANCKSTTESGNHLLVITGYNTDPQTGIPYWILQNSWGSDWGMNGRIFLPAYVNACGMANFAVTVLPPNDSGAPTQVKDSRKETDDAIQARLKASLPSQAGKP